MIDQAIPKQLLEFATAQQENEEKLLACNNVVGVALGNKIKNDKETDQPVVSVLVNQKLPRELLSENDRLPTKIKGIAIDVVEVGDIFTGGTLPNIAELDNNAAALDTIAPQTLRRRVRPAKGGYSVGHHQITAGTLGTCCYDLTPFPSTPQKYYILSNNHVLANSNNARIGDPILQPGPIDGGTYPGDVIARLTRFVPIRFMTATSAPSNYVDAAIAEGDFEDLNREVYWIGYIKRLYTAPQVGDIVQKTGRTTNFTTGEVTNINATINVNYGSGRVARFCRQIITSAMSAGGDSGSLVTDRNEGAVGLLFAGSATRTIVNNIAYVQSLLRVRVTEI
ncbi:MAG: S1 family peptidase [Porticoccaceae bacterium]|nr:S1 family peptidase [Porticoccaceae bacterium]